MRSAAPMRRNLLALSLVSFLTDASSEMIAPLLPAFLVGTLGATATWVGVIEGVAETTASLLKLASGWWSDRIARRKPLVVAGYALASAVRPLVAVATSASQVLAIRFTDRVGKGIRGAPRDALLADSVPAAERGRAFGIHRAADHAGAVVGPLVALLCLQVYALEVRTVFWLAAIPGALAVVAALLLVREVPRDGGGRAPATRASAGAASAPSGAGVEPLGRPFSRLMVVLVLFTLGNSTDAFLLLRAGQLGVPTTQLPLLWVALHVVKSASSVPGGALSDRIGRRPLIATGWLLYAAVYAGFALAGSVRDAWLLFAAYGVVFGLTEGVEKAFVADLVPAVRRGAAFGWYNAAIGAAALPASLWFGLVWDRAGASLAFGIGAGLAVLAALGLSGVRPPGRGPAAGSTGP